MSLTIDKVMKFLDIIITKKKSKTLKKLYNLVPSMNGVFEFGKDFSKICHKNLIYYYRPLTLSA
jgi:hypothetical protein